MHRRSRRGEAVAKPSEVAKSAGIPNNLIVTCPAVSARALRASRSAHETRVRALRTREDHVRGGWRSGGGRRQAHFKALVPHELDTGTPVDSAAPISPEQRCGADMKWMQQHTHLARLCGRAPIPLALLAQRARAAVANAGRIHQAQTAIPLATPLLEVKRLPCGTTQGPVGLQRKVLTSKAPGFPGGGRGRRAVP